MNILLQLGLTVIMLIALFLFGLIVVYTFFPSLREDIKNDFLETIQNENATNYFH